MIRIGDVIQVILTRQAAEIKLAQEVKNWSPVESIMYLGMSYVGRLI